MQPETSGSIDSLNFESFKSISNTLIVSGGESADPVGSSVGGLLELMVIG